jgi:hypothetical protein
VSQGDSRRNENYMKFSIQHQRSVAGNDISVAVDGEGDQVISHVTTTFDGFDIGDDELDPPCASYERKFLQAGYASPHLGRAMCCLNAGGEKFCLLTIRRFQSESQRACSSKS